MKQGVVGFVLGVVLATALSVAAARIVGDNGWLVGWTVEVGGQEVCADPYIWIATKQIECD